MSTPVGPPSIAFVAGYLIDAAKQESSVRTVVSVIKRYGECGLTRSEALRAVQVAVQAAPGLAGRLCLYEAGIRDMR